MKMMAGTPTLCKKHGGIICSFPLRQNRSHQTTAIANNHLLLADGSGISALACTPVNVRDSVAHPSKADTIKPISTLGRCEAITSF